MMSFIKTVLVAIFFDLAAFYCLDLAGINIDVTGAIILGVIGGLVGMALTND